MSPREGHISDRVFHRGGIKRLTQRTQRFDNLYFITEDAENGNCSLNCKIKSLTQTTQR